VGFIDVLTDALMVENGKRVGLTGAFQSVQWGALSAASILVGMGGGYLAERRAFGAAFALVACSAAVSFLMALLVVRDAPARPSLEAFGETWCAVREALGRRDLWAVAGFTFFFMFSPSFGPAFFYYETDVLGFSQTFIGVLASLGAAASMGMLAYLVYRGPVSGILITVVFGAIGMATQLAFLDLAAKACPPRAEATFFALLMSVHNLGMRSAEWTGANLYGWLGYTPLVLISTGFTAAAWLLVPLVPIDAIQAAAQESARSSRSTASRADS
jgi:MFS family permease